MKFVLVQLSVKITPGFEICSFCLNPGIFCRTKIQSFSFYQTNYLISAGIIIVENDCKIGVGFYFFDAAGYI